VVDIENGGQASNPSCFQVVNNVLYVQATTGSLGLRMYNITTSNAFRVLPKASGDPTYSQPCLMVGFNGKVFFKGSTPDTGIEVSMSAHVDEKAPLVTAEHPRASLYAAV